MLRIACPFCDTRDETEFHCGGDAHIERPKPDVNDTEWADYLFIATIQRDCTSSDGVMFSVAGSGSILQETRLLMKFMRFIKWAKRRPRSTHDPDVSQRERCAH